MQTKTRPVYALIGACLLAGIAVGCGSSVTESNLSPTPDQAADRHQLAIRYAQEVAIKNQQAERKAMSRMPRPLPQP